MCIKLHSYNKDTVVLDPFLGSGTTAVAAKRLGCNYIGFEIDKEYVQLAEEKLSRVRSTTNLNITKSITLNEAR